MLNNNQKFFLRNEIGAYMTTLGCNDEKVVVVNADLSGTCRNKDFVDTFPNRSFNVGIAEQNMVSFAAGLAHEGFKPYTFTMAPFLTMRACEQCRTDVAYANLNVRLVGVYAGMSGGISGATHWAIEDCGIMTSIPNMRVFEVSDVLQAKRMFDATLNIQGPIYIRISVEPVNNFYPDDFSFKDGGSYTLSKGNDGAILCSGVTVQYAMEAAAKIKECHGLNLMVVDMYSIKPIDREAILLACKTKNVLVVQDHNIYGGLGSIVSQVIAESGVAVNFKILGLNDKFMAMAHAPHLYKSCEIDTLGILKNMIQLLKIE